MWKDFFYFSRSEKRGVIILAFLICVVILGGGVLSMYRQWQELVFSNNFEEEYTRFMASLKKQEATANAAWQKRRGKDDRSYEEEQPVVLAPFDPNTADSIVFRQMGLPGWMVKNILSYRQKGGKFRTPADFRKIYGLTEEQYTTLAPYIHVDEEYRKKDTIRIAAEPYISSTPDSLKPFKYAPGTVIALNAADTTELKKIPGIGSAYARKIVNYRRQLGGFYTIGQLQEIELNVDELSQWFSIAEEETKRINLNKASVERLTAHPYFNFYQAKAIVEHRKRKGNLKRLGQIALYDEFTEKDMERLKHYVCFE